MKQMNKIIKRAQFEYGPGLNIVSVLTNPFYFVRKNLYINIKYFSKYIRGNVLDFGCGAKPYESLFKRCKKYVGVDIEVSGHDHSDENIDVYYDGKTLPFKDGEFDSVFSSEVFEHVENIDAILDEINRVMKPGGYMLVTAPFVWNEHEIPYDYNRFTGYGMEKMLKRHGFKVLKSKKSTSYVEMVFQMYMEYLRALCARKTSNLTIKHMYQRFIIAPVAIIGIVANAILPKDGSWYGDNIILCKKIMMRDER